MRYLVMDEQANVYTFGSLEDPPDFTIYCDGYLFGVNRFLLRTWIPYFESLFKTKCKEFQEDQLVLEDDYNPDLIHAMLAYCHCRDLDLQINYADIPELFSHAERWGYDDFILWFLHQYEVDFFVLYTSLQHLVEDESKVKISVKALRLIPYPPLEEDGHILLTWLKEQKKPLQEHILKDPICPSWAVKEYQKISNNLSVAGV